MSLCVEEIVEAGVSEVSACHLKLSSGCCFFNRSSSEVLLFKKLICQTFTNMALQWTDSVHVAEVFLLFYFTLQPLQCKLNPKTKTIFTKNTFCLYSSECGCCACIISPASESPQSLVLGRIVEGHGKHYITLDGPVRLFIWATQQNEECRAHRRLSQALMSLWLSYWF